MNYLITQELAQAILDYLVERPFREVFALVEHLRNIKPEAVTTEAVTTEAVE